MTDDSTIPVDDDESVYDLNAWRKKTKQKEQQAKKSRKARERKLKDSVPSTDGRSLRATGRTEALYIRIHPMLKDRLDAHVGKGKISLWVEQAILEKMEADGVDLDS